MKTIIKITMVAAISLMITTSCCNCKKGSPKIGDLEKSAWLLIELEGQAVPNSGIVLTFDAEKKMMYGKAPCNNFFAGYSLFENADQNIKISNAGRTQKFCPNSQVEDKFTMRVSTITKIKMDGGKMLMMDAEGKLIAICSPQAKEVTPQPR